MLSRGNLVAGIAAAFLCTFAGAQVLKNALGVKRVAPQAGAAGAAAEQPRILWIRNEKTGQVVYPDRAFARADELPDPVVVYDNYSNAGGFAGVNLNWNYPEASIDPEFTVPNGGEPLTFGVLDIASDPTDPDAANWLYNGEKICLIYEPYTAAEWPSSDLNEHQSLREYSSVVSSYSEQFEIRVCRISFFSLLDVNQPFDAINNPYKLEVQLSFGYVSFPFRLVQSTFRFDLSGFNPPLTVKGRGLILTHWMKLSEKPFCPGDFNLDDFVDDADFVMFLAQYNILDCADETMPEFCSADLNGDGFVDDADFQEFIRGYEDLLCPPSFVIRKAFAPLAGGRFRWNNAMNEPVEGGIPGTAIPSPNYGFVFPNTLVTVPQVAVPPPSPDLGCVQFMCEPSYLMYFSTLTGFQTVSELNMDAQGNDMAPEYERFLNQIAENTGQFGSLRPYAIYDAESNMMWGWPNTDWLPSSTAKKLSITPPENTRKR